MSKPSTGPESAQAAISIPVAIIKQNSQKLLIVIKHEIRCLVRNFFISPPLIILIIVKSFLIISKSKNTIKNPIQIRIYFLD
jgi:hypothetical protein